MAQYPPAYAWLVPLESWGGLMEPNADPVLVEPVDSEATAAAKRAAMAICGINSFYWPSAYSRIMEAPESERGPLVEEFYRDNYWAPMNAGGIDCQCLANKYLDAGVNQGSGTAQRLMQEAVVALRVPLTVDGAVGPISLEAINRCDPDALVASFTARRLVAYARVARSPEEFARWKARATKVCNPG